MRLAYHPRVQREVSSILAHYDRISPRLGDEFWEELSKLLELVATKPTRFHFSVRGMRRANLKRFPYHLLFREKAGDIRVLVLRHHRQHPSYGTLRE